MLGGSGQQLLTYRIVYDALQGIKDALLTQGWWYLAFIEIRVGSAGQVVGYATISPNLASHGSRPILNIQDAISALGQPVGGASIVPAVATPADGGTAHRRR